jgi:hypothetical protein
MKSDLMQQRVDKELTNNVADGSPDETAVHDSDDFQRVLNVPPEEQIEDKNRSAIFHDLNLRTSPERDLDTGICG